MTTQHKKTIKFIKKPTIQVHNNFTFIICNGKCKKRAMIGMSWYKRYGYNSPCQCLKNKVKLEYMDSCYCCKKFVNDDDETCMVGNNTICLECYENYYDADNDGGSTPDEYIRN